MRQMRPIEIEAWALRIIQKVNGKHPVEDSRVELKREWPEPIKAARQIAGHANAARGDDLLWLIGVDEREGVVGADATELADWLPQIQAEFESVTPEIFPVNVHDGKGVIVALHIQSKFAPYRVRVPAYGKTAGCPVKWETPWREGNQTRTISRSELLAMLMPKVQQPHMEILSALGEFKPGKNAITVSQRIYIVPPRDGFYVYPRHKAVISQMLGNTLLGGKGTLFFYLPQMTKGGGSRSAGLEVTDTEIIVRAPGALECREIFEPAQEIQPDLPLKVETYFESAHDQVLCRLSCTMQPTLKPDGRTEWHRRHSRTWSQFSVL